MEQSTMCLKKSWSNYFYCTQASHTQILKLVQKNFKPEKHGELDKKRASQASHNTATEISNLKGGQLHITHLNLTSWSTALAVYLKDLSSTQSSEERKGRKGRTKAKEKLQLYKLPSGWQAVGAKGQKDRRKLGP